MNIYSKYGHKEFLLALGYKGKLIKDYFVKNKIEKKINGRLIIVLLEKNILQD